MFEYYTYFNAAQTEGNNGRPVLVKRFVNIVYWLLESSFDRYAKEKNLAYEKTRRTDYERLRCSRSTLNHSDRYPVRRCVAIHLSTYISLAVIQIRIEEVRKQGELRDRTGTKKNRADAGLRFKHVRD